MIAALAGAVAFGSVIPVGHLGHRAPTASMLTALPVVGALLGVIVAAVLQAAGWAFGAHSLPAAAFAVTALVVMTRGLHIDGLADTADGLGCYGPPERALAVMRDGSTGPLGAVAVAVSVLLQTGAMAALPTGVRGLAAVVTAVAAGRVAAVLICRRGVRAAPGSSLGAAVAGSQPTTAIVAWCLAVGASSAFATPRIWQGPIAVAVALAIAAMLAGHCARRFGGITGDVLGASVEIATTVALLGLAVRA